jgi:outer membrane protein OmpA-like peptidoglycan-associated protein/tetratricopeptide (TPR) repeat protein
MNKYPKYLLTAFICLFFAINLSAQKSVKTGDKYAKKFDFISAIEEYKKAIDKDAGNLKAIKGLASANRHIGNFTESEAWYGKLVELDSGTPENRFYYSQALRSTKKYDKALESWNAYKSSTKSDYVAGIIDGFAYIDKLSTPNPKVQIKNAAPLNTAASDFGVNFKNLTEITFASTRDESKGEKDNWTHEKYNDLYNSIVSFDDQSAPQKFQDDQFNGIYHDGPATFLNDQMYLTRSQYKKGKVYKSKADKTVNLELVTVDLNSTSSKLKDFAEDFAFNNKEYSVGHATISADGKNIIFSSDSKTFDKNFGGTDLYMITLSGEEWSTPVNLGEGINTPADEEYPFYSAQNEIYFASDGHYGLGGLDIYTARFDGNEWTTPENVGAPFNTSYDDFNYVYSDESEFGFLSSNRPGGQGSDDIYTFKYIDGRKTSSGSILVKILTYDAETLEPLEAVTLDISKCMEGSYLSDARGKGSIAVDPFSSCKLNASLDGYFPKEIPYSVFDQDVEIEVPLRRVADNSCELVVCVYDKKTKVPITKSSVKVMSAVEGTYFTGITDENGCVRFQGIIPNNSYELVASKEITEPEHMYLSTTGIVGTNGVECPAVLNKELYLDYVQLGTPYVIENIYYDLDKYFIRPDAAVELEHIVNIMKNNPTIEIELGSHTDCRQTAEYNQELSNNRAKAAVEYIVSRGIDKSRLTYKGYGETVLVNSCACECEKSVKEIGLNAFRNCEDKQVPNCSEQQHQNNRRTEFKITKF